MTFSRKLLVGLTAGIVIGVFIGEHAAPLGLLATAYIKLLQMTVLPYVTVSIITSLGSLSYADARSLGARVGLVLLGVWGVAVAMAMLVPLAFPSGASASFFSTTLTEQRAPFDFIDLYIPSNPFFSLANNIVPAVVLFSVAIGVALIGVERKQLLLDVLGVVNATVSRATRMVVSLMPYGLFTIAASVSGTITLDQVARLQVYLVAYIAMSLVLALWVLPGLVSALTPISARELFRETGGGLVMAFMAGDLFIVLPILTEASKTLLTRTALDGSDATDLPDVIVPASFNLPHAGKLLSISFILFAGWFADAPISLAQYPALAATGFVTFFGSLNAAVPFLLDMFRIPSDTFQLFVATSVINSRFGTLAAGVHTVVVAILGSCAMRGLIRPRPGALLRYGIITGVLVAAALGGTRLLASTVLYQPFDKDKVLADMQLIAAPAHVVTHDPASPPDTAESQLDRIFTRHRLRVCYASDSLPFAYTGARGQMVGFDVELAHRLARELDVDLELNHIDRQRLTEILDAGECDLVMSGVPVTTDRAARVLFSEPYIDETLSFVVRDERRGDFVTWDDVQALGAIRIGVPNAPYYITKLHDRLPEAQIVPVDGVAGLFERDQRLDAIALPAERGSAWTLLHPEYAVVVPGPGLIKIPLAYPIARHDERFATFINNWIELKRRDGTIDQLYSHWILGQTASTPHPRWSVLRDVLRWE
jgi:Na+/H+-dicarboxylate symporter/ABC-type amino acid transport substrate-binding protein